MTNFGEKFFFNPFIIAFWMIVAFILAVRPASAGGIPNGDGGIGGAAGISVQEPVPTVMNPNTLSRETESSTSTNSIAGLVIAKDDSSITLQTWSGQRKLSISSDTVFKMNNEIAGSSDIQRGDIVTGMVNNRGELLQLNKNNSIVGAFQGLLALGAVSAIGAGIATHIYLRNEQPIQSLPTPRRYILR